MCNVQFRLKMSAHCTFCSCAVLALASLLDPGGFCALAACVHLDIVETHSALALVLALDLVLELILQSLEPWVQRLHSDSVNKADQGLPGLPCKYPQ